jgi:DNA-binding transcriptional LysR family regulator
MSSGPNSSLPQVAAGGEQHRCAAAAVAIGDSIAVPPWQPIPAAYATAATRCVTANPPSACRQAGFTPHIRQEVAETSSLVALVAAGLGVALAPASVRHLRINGVTHRPLRGPAQVTVMLAAAYRKGPVSPLVRGYRHRRSVARARSRPRRDLALGGRARRCTSWTAGR